MKARPLLSVVVPVYEEEENVRPLYERIHRVLSEQGGDYEVIFVDDGSRDKTFGVLADVYRQNGRVKVIRLRKNFGQTAAMVAGFRHAKGRVIVSMDGDLQNDPGDIPKLLAKLDEGYDLVCGWRRVRKDKLISRRVPSVVANWLIGHITGVHIHDNGCSLKAYRADIIKRVALYSELHRFIPAMATLAGARIAEIEVNHHPRVFGKSKYGIWRVWRVLLDIVLVKMLTGFAARPALWFGTLSVPGILLGGGSLIGILISGVGGVVGPAVAFLCLSLAGHLIAMGVLAEMVLRTGDFRPEWMLKGSRIETAGTGQVALGEA